VPADRVRPGAHLTTRISVATLRHVGCQARRPARQRQRVERLPRGLLGLGTFQPYDKATVYTVAFVHLDPPAVLALPLRPSPRPSSSRREQRRRRLDPVRPQRHQRIIPGCLPRITEQVTRCVRGLGHPRAWPGR
jgi:hypothetical protein